MKYRDMIPGVETATNLVNRGRVAVVQKGKDAANWGAHKAIDGIVGGIRLAMHVVGFALIAAPLFQFGKRNRKK